MCIALLHSGVDTLAISQRNNKLDLNVGKSLFFFSSPKGMLTIIESWVTVHCAGAMTCIFRDGRLCFWMKINNEISGLKQVIMSLVAAERKEG